MVLEKYVGILVDRFLSDWWVLIDNEQEGFRAVSGFVDQIFTLKQIGKKVREKKCRLYGAFKD